MNAADAPHFTGSGLPGIPRVPYGLHACHFYSRREQLAAALVPYFVAGVRDSERCLWITAEPLPASDARRAIRSVWPGAGEALASGALRILGVDEWYRGVAGLEGQAVIDLWLDEERRALGDGYAGLRIAGNTSFLHAQEWPAFMEYERASSVAFARHRIVALCSYSLENCSARQALEVMRAHHCAFDCSDGAWQVTDAAAG